MGHNHCVFLVQGGDPDEIARRVARVAAFYAPLGVQGIETERRGDALLGRIALTPVDADAPRGHRTSHAPTPGEVRGTFGAPVRWGEPSNLGAFAVFSFDGVTVGPAGPTSAYVARGAGVTAWATHAVAASLLARGEARIDPARLPEFVAAEFTADSLIAGVTPVRAQPLAPTDAAPSLDALPERLAGETAVLGLTGGLDSRVVARALVEAGAGVHAFTWGEHEAAAAASFAGMLALEHEAVPHVWLPGADGVAAMDRGARWADGAARMNPFGRQGWPSAHGPLVTGAGGETGRAFFYRRVAHGRPTRDRVVRAMSIHHRIAGADGAAITAVKDAVRVWVDTAWAAGFDGWSALDAVYAEQRLPRWGRAMVPCSSAPLVGAFATRDAQCALASLPLSDKLTDGWHHRELGEPVPALPRSRRPSVLAGVPIPRPLRGNRHEGRWPLAGLWDERPDARQFVEQHVLGWPALDEAFGARWSERLRTRFDHDEQPATETVLLLAGPALLDRALRK